MKKELKKENNQSVEKGKFNIISGKKIKHFMDINKFTAEKISMELGKEKRTYFYKTKGETEFTASEAWVLTKLFECTLDDLVKDVDDMTNFEKSRYSKVSSGYDTMEPKKISLKYSPKTINNCDELDSKKEKFNIISGNKIKHFMDINGFTAEKIAEELGKQKRTYFYKIKGETEFTASEVWILTKLFGCTLDDLVKDSSEMNDFEKSRCLEINN